MVVCYYISDYEKFVPCTDQEEINAFIRDVVPYFEGNKNIYAYAYSNGLGLGDVWPLMKGNSLRSGFLKILVHALLPICR